MPTITFDNNRVKNMVDYNHNLLKGTDSSIMDKDETYYVSGQCIYSKCWNFNFPEDDTVYYDPVESVTWAKDATVSITGLFYILSLLVIPWPGTPHVLSN
jgi:hypothetical protein